MWTPRNSLHHVFLEKDWSIVITEIPKLNDEHHGFADIKAKTAKAKVWLSWRPVGVSESSPAGCLCCLQDYADSSLGSPYAGTYWIRMMAFWFWMSSSRRMRCFGPVAQPPPESKFAE
ncbi:uncharacterized [Tachysurus ichikawai]